MRSIVRRVDKYAEEAILVSLFFAMVILIFVQVIMRYVFDNSLSWSEELARYLFIWMVFIGASYGVKRSGHINIDVVLNFVSDGAKKAIAIVANLLFIAFAVIISWLGWGLVQQMGEFGQTSSALNLPMHYVYAALPIGFLLTTIRLIQSSILLFKKPAGEGE